MGRSIRETQAVYVNVNAGSLIFLYYSLLPNKYCRKSTLCFYTLTRMSLIQMIVRSIFETTNVTRTKNTIGLLNFKWNRNRCIYLCICGRLLSPIYALFFIYINIYSTVFRNICYIEYI